MLKEIPYIEWMKKKVPGTKYDLGRTGLNYFDKRNHIPNDLKKEPIETKEITDYLSNEYNYPKKNFLITPGATFSNYLCYLFFKQKTNQFFVEEPNYDPLYITPSSLDIKVKEIQRRRKNDYSFRNEEIKNQLTENSLLIISNRHNPSGRLLDNNELRELSEIVEEKNSYLLVDEVYSPYVINEEFQKTAFGGPTALGLPNTLISNSLTKFFGMNSLRIGWLGGNKEIIQECRKYMNHFFPVSGLSEEYAKIVLHQRQELIKRPKSLLKKNNKLIKKLFDSHPELQGKIYGENTFGFIKHNGINSEKLVKECLKNNVLIVPGRFYNDKKFFRFSVAEETKNAKESLMKFKEIINKTK